MTSTHAAKLKEVFMSSETANIFCDVDRAIRIADIHSPNSVFHHMHYEMVTNVLSLHKTIYSVILSGIPLKQLRVITGTYITQI